MHTDRFSAPTTGRKGKQGAKKRQRLATAATLATACVLAFPLIASAAPTSGVEHFRVTLTSPDGPGSINIRGLLNSAGTDYQGTNADLVVFSDGAFTIKHPPSKGTFTNTLNPRSCLDKVTGTGAYTLARGYGAYTGLKGEGTYTARGTATLARSANGTCDTSASPTALHEVITGSGPASF
jgi:hypothetical protein